MSRETFCFILRSVFQRVQKYCRNVKPQHFKSRVWKRTYQGLKSAKGAQRRKKQTENPKPNQKDTRMIESQCWLEGISGGHLDPTPAPSRTIASIRSGHPWLCLAESCKSLRMEISQGKPFHVSTSLPVKKIFLMSVLNFPSQNLYFLLLAILPRSKRVWFCHHCNYL